MKPVPKKIESLLEQMTAEHGVAFSDVGHRLKPPPQCPDACAVLLLDQDTPLAPFKQRLRKRLDEIDWQYSERDNRPHLLLLASKHFVSADVVYHATRSANVSSILENGLLPSTPSRSTTGRADCNGNIYVCDSLGSVHEDSNDEAFKRSAHWWRCELSKTVGDDDTHWCILRLDLSHSSRRCYRDMWSTSGLILHGDSPVPPSLISVEWEQGLTC